MQNMSIFYHSGEVKGRRENPGERARTLKSVSNRNQNPFTRLSLLSSYRSACRSRLAMGFALAMTKAGFSR